MKIGDKVRIKFDAKSNFAGDIGTVTKLDSLTFVVWVKLDEKFSNVPLWFDENDVEIID